MESSQRARILVVDDEQYRLDAYTRYLDTREYEVHTASSVAEALDLASKLEFAAATLDYSIGRDNGSDLGKKLKALQRNIKLAGITSGNPQDFDPVAFDIRESKSALNKETYNLIVSILSKSNNPREEYHRHDSIKSELNTQLNALYLLVQGYCAARKLLRGEQPVPDRVLPIPPKEEVDRLLDLSKYGIDKDQLYTQLTAREPSIRNDTKLCNFFAQADADHVVEEDLAAHVEKLLERIL